MLFFVFAVTLWLAAMFHLWDHRRFEADLKIYRRQPDNPAVADFRRVAVPPGGLRRAFAIRGAQDVLRYGAPVGFFCLLLLWLQSWWIAGFYAAIVIVKWFALTTVLTGGGDSYRISLAGCEIFSASLAED